METITNNFDYLIREAFRKKSLLNFCLYFIGIILSYVIYKMTRNEYPLIWVRLNLLIYYFVAGIYFTRRLGRNINNILSFDIVFIILYSIFHHGYLLFYAFGVLPYEPFIFHFPSGIAKSLFITNICMIGFLTGFEIIAPNNELYPNTFRICSNSWGIFGAILIILGFLMHVLVIPFFGLSVFRQEGYTLAARMKDYGGLFYIPWNNSLRVMLIGTVIYTLYSAFNHNKLFKSKIIMIFPFVFLFLTLLEGDRGQLVMLGVPILLIHHYFVRPIKLKWIIIVGVILLLLFTIVGAGREIAFSPGKMYERFIEKRAEGKIDWKTPFLEMGGSFRTVNMTAYLVPQQYNYWYGGSWLSAGVHSIPYLEGLLLKLNIYFSPSPGYWLTYVMFGPEASGLGYSMAAEGYLNFGFWGCFFEGFIVAVVMRKLLTNFAIYPTPVTAFILIAIMGPLLRLPRAHFHSITPYFFQIILFAIFIKIFLRTQEQNEFINEYGQSS